MIFLCAIISSIILLRKKYVRYNPGDRIIFTETKENKVILKAGQYIVHCYGAQGGSGYHNGKIKSRGGFGAHVYGTMTITGEKPITFYAVVGGQGKKQSWGFAAGGFNGGGEAGDDTGPAGADDNDGSGGGGGATDLRINSANYKSRIIVAAGGSGGVGSENGAPGGDLYGRYKRAPNVTSISTKTTQTSGPENGQGEKGQNKYYVPGSGGGGGYRGGVSTGVGAYDDFYNAVGHSGSSYISGYPGCTIHPSMTFTNGRMIIDSKPGDGKLIIDVKFECSDYCSSCSNESYCTTCFTNYLLFEGTCVKSCPTYSYRSGDRCIRCEPNCATCSSLSCKSCADDYYLYNGKCLTECPNGTYQIGNKCELCTSPCATCFSYSTNCESCVSGYLLYENKCYKKCPLNTFQLGGSCYDCESPCATCTSYSTNCLTCANDTLLYENKCYESCPTGSIQSGLICLRCDTNCASCSLSVSNCDSCISEYYLYENKCYQKCPDGTFQNGSICQKCDFPCSTCTSNSNNCNSCQNELFLYNSKCYENCAILNDVNSNKYYGNDNLYKKCMECQDENCLDCSQNYLKCVKCNHNYFWNEELNKCEKIPTDIFSNSNLFSPPSSFQSLNSFSQTTQASYWSTFIDESTQSKSFSFTNNLQQTQSETQPTFLFTSEQEDSMFVSFVSKTQPSSALNINTDSFSTETNEYEISRTETFYEVPVTSTVTIESFESSSLSSSNSIESEVSNTKTEFIFNDESESSKAFFDSTKFNENPSISSEYKDSIESTLNYHQSDIENSKKPISSSTLFTEKQSSSALIHNGNTFPTRKKGSNKIMIIGIVIGVVCLIGISTLFIALYIKKKMHTISTKETTSNENHESNHTDYQSPTYDDNEDADLNFWL